MRARMLKISHQRCGDACLHVSIDVYSKMWAVMNQEIVMSDERVLSLKDI